MQIKDYCLFIDESGTADLKSSSSPYFTLASVAVSLRSRARLKDGFEDLKLKYFG